jgi:hypothetical protein
MFNCLWQAAFGEGLKLVGSHPVLGAWDIAAAPDMTWTDGHVWVADLAIPEDTDLEFKLVHLTYGGASWEQSNNRYAEQPLSIPFSWASSRGHHLVAFSMQSC